MKVKLIIGLGNPGKEYEKTYHNVGFLAIDYLAKKLRTSDVLNIKSGFWTSEVPKLKAEQIAFIKSLVYMNESGKFVAKIIKKAGIKPAEVLIVHDDSDIELGKYKLSFGRGSAGHKGAESIIKSLGAKDFWRLRIGIRPPGKNISVNQLTHQRKSAISRRKASEIVLKKITGADLKILNQVFDEITKQSN